MIRLSTKSVCLGAAIGALFLARPGVASAAEQQFADLNCAITIPDSWQVETNNMSPQLGVMAIFSDATGNRRMILQVINKKPPGPLDDRFVAEFEKGYEKTAQGAVLSGKYIQVS